ncbi:MAG: AAA family ATPase [Ignavibacteriales bacterium]|jgi:SpoVK/Ycf46/Vps4 family AAA+-type ATPase|nr:MAG: AAA family ATPase [Ignavibacteriales bacterium]
MTTEELNQLQEEAYDHLWNGRYRMALEAAKKVYRDRPDDSESAICLAWALLENGNPVKAMEFANLAVELKGDSVKAHLYRGYLLMRMSIFEGAVSDFDFAINQQKESLAWAYLNKARTLAGMEKFSEAEKTLELAILIDRGKNPAWNNIKKWYASAKNINNGIEKFDHKKTKEYLLRCSDAIKQKEYWYALKISRLIQNDSAVKKDEKLAAEYIELEAMFYLYQFRPALKKAEKLKSKFKKDDKFNSLYNSLIKLTSHSESDKIDKELAATSITSPSDQNRKTRTSEINGKTHALFFPNKNADVFSAKIFDADDDESSGNKTYYLALDPGSVKNIGLEVIFNNPFYDEKNKDYDCKLIWYLNDFEIAQSPFKLNVKKSWDSVIFVQTLQSNGKVKITTGQARVDVYIDNFKVCEKWFVLGDRNIKQHVESPNVPRDSKPPKPETTEDRKKVEISAQIHEADSTKSLEELFEELNKFIGLNNVKNSLKDFVDYLKFMQERQKLGLKSTDKLSLHTLFLGNPGTGKTTIARLLGQIFKTMGILNRGHVVEVDRSGLVGQFIGETAQKTEKVIEASLGGVLFIDEAYTLSKKGGSGQDFGQEAIDVLLKRMEDKKGEFFVIAAGYPEEMQIFMDSNPGLKSRFTRTFMFEDYAPDELLQIYLKQLESEEYKIEDDAKEVVKKHFINLYRKRDKSFGNARLCIQFFEDSKINIGKRYLSLPDDQKTKEQMTTIFADDVQRLLVEETTDDVKIPINEEALTEAMNELNSLTGIESVKNDIKDIVKLVRYYHEKNEDVSDKFSSHILFVGNPGTGKTTVARLVSSIYAALGILKKGHMIETDRQGLVASYVGQTAEKTKSLIDKAIGGTLFIDEAYALVKKDGSGNDFGNEAVDVLIKRMEDDRGKFIVIAAGYTDEMKRFLESNPGLQSRFTKTFHFKDYDPNELMEITADNFNKSNLKLSADASEKLMIYYNELYRNRDKNFGNARIVRTIVDKAKQNALLRKAEPKDDSKKVEENLIIYEDIKSILSTEEQKETYQIIGNPEKLEKELLELNSLTGLESVKSSVEKLISSIKVSQLRKQQGLKVIEKSLHAVFVGNPGTGKTTVARILSNIYKELGLLEKGHLVEVDRAGLVAGYQGQTAIKTNDVIQQALGGTLFIDEAYTLSRGVNDFGQEAIDTLLKRMEDNRGQFVVIVAGYPAEMKKFISSNPGLQSRFENILDFEDYNARQLLEISAEIAVQHGYNLDEGALQLLLEIFQSLYSKRDKNFGNARTAKNILYKAISYQEERISQMFEHSKDDLMTIRFEDVEKVKKELI